MLTRRSRAREVAFQILFQHDVNPSVARAAIARFAHDRLGKPEAEAFCLALYDGVTSHLAEIDARISAASENWKLQRMAASDRNVLRLGAYEIAFAPQSTPGPVALDEAIELARRYGSKDSPAFVNGVLDRVFREFTQTEGMKEEAPSSLIPPPV